MNPPLNGPTLTRLLCLGANGREVGALQRLLNQMQGGPRVPENGRFETMTHRALLNFQRQHGLKPDGVVGPSTASALGWNYRAEDSRPYIISYEQPPLPPMTPPLVVLADLIWSELRAFQDKMVDDLSHVYDGYHNPRATSQQYETQRRQSWARFGDIEWLFDRIKSDLDKLKAFTAGQEAVSVEQIEANFEFFRTTAISDFQAMDFAGADTDLAVRHLNSLPFRQIGRILRNVINGDLWVKYAISQISNEFAMVRQGWTSRA